MCYYRGIVKETEMKIVKATQEQQDKFLEIFRVPLSRFISPPLFDFDIIKFDQFIAPPDGTSLQSQVIQDYDADVSEFVRHLNQTLGISE